MNGSPGLLCNILTCHRYSQIRSTGRFFHDTPNERMTTLDHQTKDAAQPMYSLTQTPIHPKLSFLTIISYFAFCMVCAVYALLLVGQVTTLTCEHVETNDTVNCVLRRNLLSVIPLGHDDISDLRGAKVSEFVDQDGDLSHRIELITSQGVVPLTSQYIPGSGSYQNDVAARINDFVDGTSTETLIVTDHLFAGFPSFDTREP